MTANHTPTPWTATHRRGMMKSVRIDEHFAIAGAGPTLAFLPEGRVDIQEANAAHIVRCVNAHDELVAALQYAAEQGGDIDPQADDSDLTTIEVTVGWLREVRDALAKVDTP